MNSSNEMRIRPCPALLFDLCHQLDFIIGGHKWIMQSQEIRRKELESPRNPWGSIDFCSPQYWVNSQFPTKEARVTSNLFVLDKMEGFWKEFDAADLEELNRELEQGKALLNMGLRVRKQLFGTSNEFLAAPQAHHTTLYVNVLRDLQKISEFMGLYDSIAKVATRISLVQIKDYRQRQAGKEDDLFFRAITVPNHLRRRPLALDLIWIDQLLANDHKGKAYLGMLEKEAVVRAKITNVCDELMNKVNVIKPIVAADLAELQDEEGSEATNDMEDEEDEDEEEGEAEYYPDYDEQVRRIEAWLEVKDSIDDGSSGKGDHEGVGEADVHMDEE